MRLSTITGVVILLLALGAIAQQGGAPTRGAGSGGSSTRAPTTYGGTYGTTWGANRRCVYSRNGAAPAGAIEYATNNCTTSLRYPVGVNIGLYFGTAPDDAGMLAQSFRSPCDGVADIPDSNCSIRGTRGLVWRGNDAGLGGFHAWIRWFRTVGQNTNRVFAGLRTVASGSAMDCQNPNEQMPLAAPDTVFMYCGEGQANYSICSNDATPILDGGTGYENAQCTTLGPNFPCSILRDGGYVYEVGTTVGFLDDDGSFYDLILTSDPGGVSGITYYVRDIQGGHVASGLLTTKLPTNTEFMNYELSVCNGSDGGFATIGQGHVCLTTK